MSKFSRSEFIFGALSTVLLFLKLGWWALPLAAVTSIFWALGGAFYKPIRRFGVPLAVFIISSFILGFHWIFLLAALAGWAILTSGDGYPDFHPSTEDEGSWIGKRIYNLNFFSDYWGGLLTKAIVVALVQLAWLPIFLLRWVPVYLGG